MSNVKIEWTGGSLEAAIQQTIFPQVRDNVAKRLRATRCPEHHTAPTSVTVTGHSLDTLQWHATGCCDKLVEAMGRAVSDR